MNDFGSRGYTDGSAQTFLTSENANTILHLKLLIIVLLTLMSFTDSHVFSITRSRNITSTVKFHWRTALLCFSFTLVLFWLLYGPIATFSVYKYWEFQVSDWVVWIEIPVFFNVTSCLKSRRAFEGCRLAFVRSNTRLSCLPQST